MSPSIARTLSNRLRGGRTGRHRAVEAIARGLALGKLAPTSLAEDEAWDLRRELSAHALSGVGCRAAESGALAIPNEVHHAIRGDWIDALRKSQAIDLECERLARAYRKSTAALSPPILLKGAAIAARYRDPPLRTYVDADILVPHSELEEWGELLRTLGYHVQSAWHERTARFGHDIGYRRTVPGTGLTLLIELHRSMGMEREVRRFEYSALSQHLSGVRACGLPILTPAAQLMVIALHLWRQPSPLRLLAVRDYVEIADPSTLASARSLARAHGLERVLAEAMDTLAAAASGCRHSLVRRGPFAQATGRSDLTWRSQIALARELGFREGLGYLASRFDPGRFREGGKWRSALVREWISRQIRRAGLGGRG